MSITVSSGNEYSYSFLLKDGKNLQTGNCIVTNVNIVQVQFTDVDSRVPFAKKLGEVKFSKPIVRKRKA